MNLCSTKSWLLPPHQVAQILAVIPTSIAKLARPNPPFLDKKQFSSFSNDQENRTEHIKEMKILQAKHKPDVAG